MADQRVLVVTLSADHGYWLTVEEAAALVWTDRQGIVHRSPTLDAWIKSSAQGPPRNYG